MYHSRYVFQCETTPPCFARNSCFAEYLWLNIFAFETPPGILIDLSWGGWKHKFLKSQSNFKHIRISQAVQAFADTKIFSMTKMKFPMINYRKSLAEIRELVQKGHYNLQQWQFLLGPPQAPFCQMWHILFCTICLMTLSLAPYRSIHLPSWWEKLM